MAFIRYPFIVLYLSCCIEDDHSINCNLCVPESLKDITNDHVDALATMIFKFLELQVRF